MLRQRVVDECLVAYLHDDVDSWNLRPDGTYEQAHGAKSSKSSSTDKPGKSGHSAQAALAARYGVVAAKPILGSPARRPRKQR